ncbi:MAG: hypothetical protein NTZ90_16920 [Proteobacteria bacterium]|nr:hypothetical protein [Pseudomonadota bacterium]
MSFDIQKRDSLRLLTGLESGKLSSADAFNLSEELDPVVVHLVLRYLREKYPASEPSSSGVTSRLLELMSTYSQVAKRSKIGEKDSVSEWFEETYSMGEFYDKAEEMIGLIVDKLES